MFKRYTSMNVNKYADAYYNLMKRYDTESAIYLKNSILMDDPKLDDPINVEIVHNINELLDKVTDLRLYKQKRKIK